MTQAGDLRCKVSFYVPDTGVNEYGEDTNEGLKLVKEDVPTQIIPITGANRNMEGDLRDTEVTHKMRIRDGAVALVPEMVAVYKGQRYDVRYWQPVYNNQRFIEIMTVMEVAV